MKYLITILFFANFLIAQAQNKIHYSLIESEEEQIGSETFKKVYDNDLQRTRLIKNTIIIKFNNTAETEVIKDYLLNLKLKIISNLGNKTFLCKLKKIDQNLVSQLNNIKTLIEKQNQDLPLVEVFDLNEYREIDLFGSNDSLGKLEWHLNNDGINGIKAGADINAYKAWELTKGQGIKIAVIDTGIDPKLKERVNILGDGVNARIIDPSIGDERTSTAYAPKNSKENHATAIIGIINANNKNNGLSGVAPDSVVIPIRLINDDGMTSTAQIIYAFQKADALGAQIINCSWGSVYPSIAGVQSELSDSEKDLYKTIASEGNNGKGIITVFASGNNSYTNFNTLPEARSEFNLAIGASDSSDSITSYSNLAEELDLIAPGGDSQAPIYTLDRTDTTKINQDGIEKIKIQGYNKGNIATSFKGTSAAAAVASGTAGLVLSINPSLTAKEVKDILLETADPISCPSTDNNECGAGRINAGEAVYQGLRY